jgi:hypothetical protein
MMVFSVGFINLITDVTFNNNRKVISRKDAIRFARLLSLEGGIFEISQGKLQGWHFKAMRFANG